MNTGYVAEAVGAEGSGIAVGYGAVVIQTAVPAVVAFLEEVGVGFEFRVLSYPAVEIDAGVGVPEMLYLRIVFALYSDEGVRELVIAPCLDEAAPVLYPL